MSWPHPHGPVLCVWASDAREVGGVLRRDVLFLVDPDGEVKTLLSAEEEALGVDVYFPSSPDVWPPMMEALGDNALAYAGHMRVGLRGVPLASDLTEPR